MPRACSNRDMKRKCPYAPNCGCHATTLPTPEAIERHEKEVTRRMAWCIQNKKTPAHDFIHLAPGDDSEFVYGIAPWNPDGTVNPPGVYTAPLSESEKQFTQLGKDSEEFWICRACSARVNMAPRKWQSKNGEEEPWNWWFCFDCKQTKVKPSKKELAITKLASQNNKMDKFLHIYPSKSKR